MTRLTYSILILALLSSWVYGLDDPIYFANDVKCSGFTVVDFYVYPYTDAYDMYYARIRNDENKYYEYVNLNTKYFFKGAVVGDEKAYVSYETYGSSGMIPCSESYLYGFVDKAKFDSVLYLFSYSSRDGSNAKFENSALKIRNALIQPFFGSTSKISGSGRNESRTVLKFPTVFVCVYKNKRCILNKFAFLDAPDNILSPGTEAAFYTYVDLPASYDSIQYLSNYSVSLTGAVTSVAMPNKMNNLPNTMRLFQNFPNPFNGRTMIGYAVTEQGEYWLQIYNQNGQVIADLRRWHTIPGEFSWQFDSGDLASGTYYYSISSGSSRLLRKMALIK
jgi:hypothetical protein